MSRSPRTRRTGVAAAIGVMVGALALTGCGAGQITQTSTQVSAVGGALATVGDIAVRDAEIEYENAEGAAVYAVGGNAPLNMHLVNTGSQADKLISASSPVARSVEVGGNTTIPGGRVLLVEGEGAAQPAAPAEPTSGARPATEEPTAAPVPTVAPGPQPAPTSAAPASASTAPSGSAQPASTGEVANVVLVGVNQQIRPGLTYAVTLVFEKAGSVTVNVPVANPTAPRTESAPE